MAGTSYDVAIIGGGVVGCAILHGLTMKGYKCILLEKNQHLVSGASSGNSGQLARMDIQGTYSLESQLCTKSKKEMLQFLAKSDIPHMDTGGIVVALNNTEKDDLVRIYTKALENGVNDVKILSKTEVLDLEPNITSEVVGGLLVPGEIVLDSCLYPVALAHHALRNGAKIQTNNEVTSAKQSNNGTWSVKSNQGTISSKLVINAAGLFGDSVDQIGLGSSSFRIKPIKGEFAVYNTVAGQLIKHMILPVPTERSKGVIAFISAYGNLVIGPTAEDTNEKESPSIKTSTIESLASYGKRIIPKLKDFEVIDTYAGIRPATEFRDYQILSFTDKMWLTVGGIRSTGVTGSLGIANHVGNLLKEKFKLLPSNKTTPSTDALAPPWVSNQATYVLDGAEYKITHKLMQIGLNNQAKL